MSEQQNDSNQLGSYEASATNTNPSDVSMDEESEQIINIALQEGVRVGDTSRVQRVVELLGSMWPKSRWGPEGSDVAPTEKGSSREALVIDSDSMRPIPTTDSADTPAGTENEFANDVPHWLVGVIGSLRQVMDPSNPLVFHRLVTMADPIEQAAMATALAGYTYTFGVLEDVARTSWVKNVLGSESWKNRRAAQSSIATNAEDPSASNDTDEAKGEPST